MNNQDFQDRISQVSSRLASSGQELLLVTPGADLRYLTGYDALPLERLTCLAVTAEGKSWMIVPELEKPSAIAHHIPEKGIELLSWNETQNPYVVLAKEVGLKSKVLVNNLMWVEKAWHLQDAFGSKVSLANGLIAQMRAIKTEAEVKALFEAGAAIDMVHSQMSKWLKPGRTEREVGRDIANAIIESGHSTVDFVIVASGPNGASPHHEVSDRVINAGEPVVVDIGGTMPSGYCSDSTRTYVCGSAPSEYLDFYAVLQHAQAQACHAATTSSTCEQIDSVARDILTGAGLGDYFIHRTGHGIGLETHEEPYLVSGNSQQLQNGHAFSIEPGFYIPNKYGARIEDILVCVDGKGVSANNTTHDLVEL